MLMNMKDILAVAKENKFALPAFNISDYSMFLGIMEVCEETNSPVIIEIHPDELSFIPGVQKQDLHFSINPTINLQFSVPTK